MKKSFLIILFHGFTHAGCLDQTLENESINIKMISVFEEPSYVKSDTCNTEWFEPHSIEFTLKNVILTYLDTAQTQHTLSLLDESDINATFKITNRLQKIVSKEITTNELGVDLIGSTIQSIKVIFSNQITSSSKYSDALTATLGALPSDSVEDACTFETVTPCDENDEDNQCSITYTDSSVIQPAQSYHFVIQVNSKRTIRRTTEDPKEDTLFIFPTLDISMDLD